MMTSPNVGLNTRSASPLAARAWTILKSWRWNSSLAIGLITSVRAAVTSMTSTAAARTRRNRRSRLTPAALHAMISRSPARRPTASAAAGADRADRLDRFRELAASRLGLAQLGDGDAPIEAYRDIYALLDDEIVESLASGGPFASLAFLQDRLDTFAEAWGGATLRLSRAGPLFVGAFTLDERSAANSVRVYGRLGAEPALLSAVYGQGRPSVHLLPAAADGAAVLVAWEGLASRWGTRPLHVELLRRDGDRMRVAWSTTDVFAEGLLARSWAVRGAEVRIRYELRYPGWAPGCEGQTEQEDVYRVTPNVVTG